MAQILFYLFAIIAVLGAVFVILHRNPIYSVLSLILTFFALAGIYVLLSAHFIAIVHIAVYAGAIMVLFLFTVMLLNVKVESKSRTLVSKMKWIALPAVVIAFAEMGYFVFKGFSGKMIKENELGVVENIGKNLFSKYVFPFEVTSVLLVVAIVGALYLSKRKLGE
ncbi:MAG: NADH-quinone oxidoreductase subunit J [Calditrichia bacterium]